VFEDEQMIIDRWGYDYKSCIVVDAAIGGFEIVKKLFEIIYPPFVEENLKKLKL